MKKWLASLILICLLGRICFAAYPTKSYTFVNNTVADADEVNANFDALYNGFSTGLNDINSYRLYISGNLAIDSNRNATLGTGAFTGTITGTRETLTDWLTVGGTMGVTGKLSAVNIATSGWQTVAGTMGVTGLLSPANVATSGWQTVAGTLGATGLTTVTSLTATGLITGTREALSDWLTVAGTMGVTGLFSPVNTIASGWMTVAGTIGATGQITGVNAKFTGTTTIETLKNTTATITNANITGTATIETLSLPQCSRVEAWLDTVTNLPTGAWSVVTFEVEVVDTRGEYNISTGIFTATKEGSYAVAWGVMSQAETWAAGDVFKSALSKNNSLSAGSAWGGSLWVAAAATSMAASSVGTAIVYLNASDNLRIRVFHNYGSLLGLSFGGSETFFTIHKIS